MSATGPILKRAEGSTRPARTQLRKDWSRVALAIAHKTGKRVGFDTASRMAPMAGDRHSVAEQLDLITDPLEKTEREAENGVRQYNMALAIVRNHVKDADRPFRLRSRHAKLGIHVRNAICPCIRESAKPIRRPHSHFGGQVGPVGPGRGFFLAALRGYPR